MFAYKLFRERKNLTYSPLFINKRQIIPMNEWLIAENHPTKGFAIRPGWHVCSRKHAPHLKKQGRRWFKVEIKDYIKLIRPKNQGGVWYLSQKIKLIEKL